MAFSEDQGFIQASLPEETRMESPPNEKMRRNLQVIRNYWRRKEMLMGKENLSQGFMELLCCLRSYR